MNGKDFCDHQKSQRNQWFTPDERKRRRTPGVIHRLSTEGTYPQSIHNHANHAGKPDQTSLKDQTHKDGSSDSDDSDSDASDSDSDAYSSDSDAYNTLVKAHDARMLYSSEENQ
jgi:hypothetical protein